MSCINNSTVFMRLKYPAPYFVSRILHKYTPSWFFSSFSYQIYWTTECNNKTKCRRSL